MATKSVAVIGASTDRRKYGNKAVRAYVNQGWAVYPVHPTASEIEGLAAYKSVADVPGGLERASLYLPPAVGIDVLDDVAAKRPAEFYVNPGAEDDELITRAKELGLDPIMACSIIAVGESPADFG